MADDLVLTPGGYRPRANVHYVPPGHLVRQNGNGLEIHHRTRGLVSAVGEVVRHAEGQPLLPANVSTLRPGGASAALGGVRDAVGDAATINGWVSFASWSNDTGSPITSLTTTWVTPPEPTNKGGQTIFLFNGLQNSNMIYQPVLQWGASAAGGGQKWSVACWYADSPAGHSFYSLLVDVAPGDPLVGVMSLASQNGGLFSYTSEFVGMPDTSLPIYNVDELSWACETLEAYAISTRDDFPDADATDFSAIDLLAGGAAADVNWQASSDYPAIGSQAAVVTNSGNGGEIRVTY